MERVSNGMFFAKQGWYPAGAEACRWQIDQYLDTLQDTPLPATLPGRAGIVPHAGWMFSGALAAQVFGALAERVGNVDTVVLFGGHLGARSRSWLLSEGVWPTPLGDVDVDTRLAHALGEATSLPRIGPADYDPDNTIELQVPLLRRVFPDSRLVVAGVAADAHAVDVGRAAVEQATRLDRSIVVVGSTDLTHYGPNYGFSPHGRGEEAVRWVKEENDARAVELMTALDAETLRTEALQEHFCCCPGAASAAVGAARAAGATTGYALSTLTSYDIRPGESFVGYAAVVF